MEDTLQETEYCSWMLATHRRNRGRGHGDSATSSSHGAHVTQVGNDTNRIVRSSQDVVNLAVGVDYRHVARFFHNRGSHGRKCSITSARGGQSYHASDRFPPSMDATDGVTRQWRYVKSAWKG